MLNYKKIKEKYPDKIPIIVKRAKNCKLDKLEKNKFLVFDSMTLGEFLLIIRKNLKLNEAQSLILFINNTLEANSSIMSEIHNKHSPNDILEVIYTSENTFG